VEGFDNITSKSGNTFLVNIVGLGTKLPNCKNEPSKEQDGGVGPSKESSSSRIPLCGDPVGLTVGNLDMLCLRRRANSSYGFERQMIRRHQKTWEKQSNGMKEAHINLCCPHLQLLNLLPQSIHIS